MVKKAVILFCDLPDDPAGIADSDASCGDILCDNGTGSDNAVLSDPDTGQDDGARADSDMVFNDDRQVVLYIVIPESGTDRMGA